MSGPNKNLNTALDRIKAYFENCPEISAVWVEFEVNKRKEYFDRKHFFELYHQQALKRLDQQRSN